MRAPSFWIAFSLLFGTLLADVQEEVTGLSFPEAVNLTAAGKTYQLEETGVASLKMYGFKIYGMAHYLQKEAFDTPDAYNKIFQDTFAKQMTLKYLMGASVRQVQNGIRKAFRNSLDDATYSQLANEIDTYISFFNQPLSKGDEQIIRWIPGGQIQLEINGTTVGTLTHPGFAEAVWNLWFGPTSDVDRNRLAAKLPTT
jgi:hypothetical protein